MLKTYLLGIVRLALASSWKAVNGLAGGAIGGSATIFFGPFSIFPLQKSWGPAADSLLTFLVYAILAWACILLFHLVFVAPYQIWKRDRTNSVEQEPDLKALVIELLTHLRANRLAGKAPVEQHEMQRNLPAPPKTNDDPTRMYFVDFRARTAASYGHAFAWYGRTDAREFEVAGLHPASESVVPYILGHFVPVPSETGASYGDLDEKYLTASYRVLMDEGQAARVFAYINHLQATSPLWHAAAYNCVAFVQDIARAMGLQVPHNHLLMPEKWVSQLRALNGGGGIGFMPFALANGQKHKRMP
jgi:hypothetical protein